MDQALSGIIPSGLMLWGLGDPPMSQCADRGTGMSNPLQIAFTDLIAVK